MHARRAAPLASACAALGIGLALTALALVLTLTGAPGEVSASNGVRLDADLGKTRGVEICQRGETLPRATTAVRLSLEATIGPRVAVAVFAGTHELTGGTRGSGWTAVSVTVPVRALARTVTNATLCFAVARTRVHVDLLGAQTGPASAAQVTGGAALPGRLRVEEMRSGRASWASLALSVARRMGLGRAFAGTWVSALAAALMLALALTTSWLLVRAPRIAAGAARRAQREPRDAPSRSRVAARLRRVPRGAWGCALVALLNAVCWSVITPPFQVPDEPSHFAYVALLAERGTLPSAGAGVPAPEVQLVQEGLNSDRIRFQPAQRALASVEQQRVLERDLAAPLPRVGSGGAGAASNEPPLYYALEVVPYELGSGWSLLGSLALMRLFSALLAALTALFAYLFVREALPGARWAWTVGGLAVAVFPLLGFMSGGVSPDALLFAECAALYYCLARAFRHGLTRRLAVALGLLSAAGFSTKLNFVGFAPGVLLGLLVLGARMVGAHPNRGEAIGPAVRRVALALALALSPVALYACANVLAGKPLLGSASATLAATRGSLLHELSYIWQFYLPRLPGMQSYFPGVLTTRQLWFDGLVGMYGWADTLFPGWVYDVALAPALLIAALGLRELVRRRAALPRRTAELAVYGTTAVGVMALVGAQSYVSDVLEGSEPFWEPRYALPMLGLWGLLVALAARGAGRRWGPATGTLLVVLLFAHDLFSQLQTIARYYG